MPAQRQHHHVWAVKFLIGHIRVFISIAVGIVASIIVRETTNLPVFTAGLAAWIAGVAAYLALAWFQIAVSDEARIDVMARRSDEGRGIMLALCLLAACASIVAIVLELGEGQKDHAALHHGIAIATIVSSWAFVHTAFAFHYAHEYYDAMRGGGVGGLDFPGDDKQPDYFDFAYFSFVIGTSAQTADVCFTNSPMRRLGLIHCIIAFVFNTGILALLINIAAGMLSK